VVAEPTKPIEVFFSYSHKDQRLRDQLETQLSLLKRENIISSWHDRRIGAGEEWASQIDAHLNTAQIILLLISPDFMASDYCYGVEMERAMKRHDRGEACIIPVILRPCDWHNALLSKLQALPEDGRPITTSSNRDRAFLDVAKGIRKAIKRFTTNSEVIAQTEEQASKQLTLDPHQEENSSRPPPQFTHRGGPLLGAVKVFTIFWGTVWREEPQTSLAQQLNQFFDFILTSPLIDQLAEYSVPDQPIEYGERIGTVTLTEPSWQSLVSPSLIRHIFQREISINLDLPRPTPNTLYFIYLPPGVIVGNEVTLSCSYHDHINENVFYVVIPYPDYEGCTGGLADFDALTLLSAHDLCDAITDPIPGYGWFDDIHIEIGDPCAFKAKKLGAYTVQLEWSNKSNACI
jgi:TIR domain